MRREMPCPDSCRCRRKRPKADRPRQPADVALGCDLDRPRGIAGQRLGQPCPVKRVDDDRAGLGLEVDSGRGFDRAFRRPRAPRRFPAAAHRTPRPRQRRRSRPAIAPRHSRRRHCCRARTAHARASLPDSAPERRPRPPRRRGASGRCRRAGRRRSPADRPRPFRREKEVRCSWIADPHSIKHCPVFGSKQTGGSQSAQRRTCRRRDACNMRLLPNYCADAG